MGWCFDQQESLIGLIKRRQELGILRIKVDKEHIKAEKEHAKAAKELKKTEANLKLASALLELLKPGGSFDNSVLARLEAQIQEIKLSSSSSASDNVQNDDDIMMTREPEPVQSGGSAPVPASVAGENTRKKSGTKSATYTYYIHDQFVI